MPWCGVAWFASIFFVQASVPEMLQSATALPISEAAGAAAGTQQAHMVWYGMVWYGMLGYGMAWYGMV